MIKSSKDTRYAIDSLVTHDGTKFLCWALPNLASFEHNFVADAFEKVDVIGIDESQFFDDLYDFCYKAADLDGRVAEFDTPNFGKEALFTLRKTDDKKTVLIGGAGKKDVLVPEVVVNTSALVS